MKILNAGIAIAILAASSAAMAEGGGDRVYGRTMQENQHAMGQYAIKNGKAVPEIVHYKYGLGLDIAKVVNVTPTTKYCGAGPFAHDLRRLQWQAQHHRVPSVGQQLSSWRLIA